MAGTRRIDTAENVGREDCKAMVSHSRSDDQRWNFTGAVTAAPPARVGEKQVRVCQSYATQHAQYHFLCTSQPISVLWLCPSLIHCSSQVLGHYLSPQASKLFDTAQSAATWSVRLLPSLEDDINTQACRAAIEHNAEQFLMR